MRRLAPVLLFLFLPLLQASSPGETSVERVGKVVTGAVESLSKKILNTTATNTTSDQPVQQPQIDHLLDIKIDTSSSEGRAALDDARRQASLKSGETMQHHSCGPACAELSNTLLAAVEGPMCRTVFATGKCPGNCMAEIASVTGNSSWTGCKESCDGDVVSGAGERWAKLCGSRQETLIDAGKEAVKTLVGEGLTAGLKRRSLLQLLAGLLILLLAVAFGYRKGRVIVFRLGKRRISRKNSDANLPV